MTIKTLTKGELIQALRNPTPFPCLFHGTVEVAPAQAKRELERRRREAAGKPLAQALPAMEYGVQQGPLETKLNPARFPGMSPKMGAIVGCILNQPWTEPRLIALRCTSDGCILGMAAGDIGFNHFIGAESDLKRNWRNLLDAAGLTTGERKAAEALYMLAVRGPEVRQ